MNYKSKLHMKDRYVDETGHVRGIRGAPTGVGWGRKVKGVQSEKSVEARSTIACVFLGLLLFEAHFLPGTSNSSASPTGTTSRRC
jgi:hypothetical protein